MIKLELSPTMLLPVLLVTSCAESRPSVSNPCPKGCPVGYICTVEGTCVPNVVAPTIDNGRAKGGSTADAKAPGMIDTRNMAIDTMSSIQSPDASSRIAPRDTSGGGATVTGGVGGTAPVSTPTVLDSGNFVDTVAEIQPTAGSRGTGGSGLDAGPGGSGGTGGTGGRQVDAGSVVSAISSCGPGITCSEGLKCFSGQCCPPPALGGVCNHFPACGCTGTSACYPYEDAHAMICIANANLTEGADCRGESNCQAGLGCFGGICVRYCNDKSDCPVVGGLQSCISAIWSVAMTDIEGVKICRRICDPVHPQNPKPPLLSCPAGFGCSANEEGVSICRALKTRTGTLCESGSECPVGQYCTSVGWCNDYCFVDADCPTGESCRLAFNPPQFAGAYQVGYCLQLF